MKWYFRYDAGGTVLVEASGILNDELLNYALGEEITVEVSLASQTAWENARKMLRYAGNANYGVDIAGEPWYTNREEPVDYISSHIALLEPETEAFPFESVWVLIVGGKETTPPPGTFRSVAFNCFTLADPDKKPNRSDVTALGTTVM